MVNVAMSFSVITARATAQCSPADAFPVRRLKLLLAAGTTVEVRNFYAHYVCDCKNTNTLLSIHGSHLYGLLLFHVLVVHYYCSVKINMHGSDG